MKMTRAIIVAMLICMVALPAAAGTPGPLARGALQQGSEQAAAPKKQKNVLLAFVMSVFVPTSGQFYNGQTTKGIVGVAVLATGLAFHFASAEDNDDEALGDPGLVLAAGTWLWSMIDAPISAAKINAGDTADDTEPMGYAPPAGWGTYAALSRNGRSAQAGVLLRF
jgi:hypothetical protein